MMVKAAAATQHRLLAKKPTVEARNRRATVVLKTGVRKYNLSIAPHSIGILEQNK
jgi:hypothetical protein